MKKIITIILTILIFTGNLIGQEESDTTAFTTGFEPAYHNVAILQAPKDIYYFKNTDIYTAFGKNFANRVEVELGLIPFIQFYFYEVVNFKAKYVFPISEKLNLGFGYNLSAVSVLTVDNLFYPIYTKQEIFTGITYKKTRSLHSFNLHFGDIQGFYDEYEINKMLSYSMSYVYMNKFSRNWSVISDNKLYVIHVDYDFPEELGNFGDFNLYLLENVMAFRYHTKRHNIDFGVWYLLGMKEWEFKFTPAPYISYSLNFLKKSERR